MNKKLEEQLELTAMLVEQFEASREEVETPRSVDHFMTVPRRRAEALCADLQALGFRIYNRQGGLRRVSLEFDRDDAIDAASAETFVRQIMEVAERHGGDYDGWGAMSLARGEPVVEPDDLIDAGDVPVAAEQSRLRAAYAERLLADGCPPELAGKLARSLKLWVNADVWGLSNAQASSSVSGRYSPSQATSETDELAEALIEDNRRRRRPRW